jgi:hypothetical protein
MNHYHRGSSTEDSGRLMSELNLKLRIRCRCALSGNFDLLPSSRASNCCSSTLIYPEALIKMIKKSKLGDTVPMAIRTLHAKRVPIHWGTIYFRGLARLVGVAAIGSSGQGCLG